MTKSLFMTVLLIGCLAAGINCPSASDSRKTRIAVLDFQTEGAGAEIQGMGRVVAEWLTTYFVETGRFDVVERRLLDKVVSEQRLGAAGMLDEANAVRLGRLLGARDIVTGMVMGVGKHIEINARVISVEDGSILAAVNVMAESAAGLRPKVSEIGEKIISSFPVRGYVIERKKDMVTIDLGRAAGVKEGMKFIVIREGGAISHPKTGDVVDIEQIEVGIIEIRAVREKTSTGVIRKEVSSMKVESGMTVRSIPEKQEYSLPPEEEKKPVIPLPSF